ncbi:MAG: ASKHA domain-containing protein [Acutalibacteraceae bacterium]|jgi:uncharacterized 2Fe-2S/4Fe-4S cluster protein (DUF4445 family)
MAVITLNTGGQTVHRECAVPVSAMEFLRGCETEISALCGGTGRCGKCRVFARGSLSAVTEEEKRMLRPDELRDGVRLACRLQLLGDAELTLCRESRLTQIRTAGVLPRFSFRPMFLQFGAAVDLGTTTIAVQLCGPDGMLTSASAPNPQRRFGADVITRIGQSLAGHSRELAECVREEISALLCRAAHEARISAEQVDAFVITGNTTMLYLLTEKNPEALSHAPFQADELFGCRLPAASLGLPGRENAAVYLPRCASAFVGADIITALLAGETCRSAETTLFADIGTNGEIALWDGKKLTCCSTAAGPAFEGVGLSCGMQGAPGAIDHVFLLNGRPVCSVVGDETAKGICGSGVVDALAVLLQNGMLDESGLLDDRFNQQPGSTAAFALAPGVQITQKDIRMVQLAKSAVCAGMKTLLRKSGITAGQVRRLQIAGGFGSYLNLDSAAAIGLFPPQLQNRAFILGNAALSGAVMLLLNREFVAQTDTLAQNAVTVDLSTDPIFLEEYTENMLFGSE